MLRDFHTQLPNRTASRLLLAALIACCLSSSSAQKQDKTQKNSSRQEEDVIRVRTELVQTDVTVLDKQGRFVEGLKREEFELRVEGKPQPISFFEPVITQGPSPQERPAGSGSRSSGAAVPSPQRQLSPQGRNIFFFVDDVHLAPENLVRARKSLLAFIENQMAQNDQLAIVSTSGQVGFLQQLTNNRTVLREAVARLNNQRNPETYAGKVTISEYDAAQVSEHFNYELFRYLVEATAAEYQTDTMTAAAMVINRVHQIGMQSRTATVNTLGALLGLMRSSAALPGRKIVFFITDGFVADPRASNITQMLRELTKAAAQVGAVVYSLDARGTFADPATDATRNGYPDYTGSVSRNLFAETIATQEPLQMLAADTGGRAFFNSNSFEDSYTRALNESSNYYLLAWRPDRDEQRNGRARILVSVKGRPDLNVRVRRGFVEAPKPAVVDRNKTSALINSPNIELYAALGSLYPLRGLPVSLSVGYNLAPGTGTMLTASMQIDAGALDPANAKREFDVLGVAIDDRGTLSSFKQKVTIDPDHSSERSIVWNQQLPLAPGLYQVRVAVRERETGRTGSAMQWLEVADLNNGQFNLSSLFLGERKPDANDQNVSAPHPVVVNVNHRFARTSALRFQTYIYNAAHATSAANVEIQTRVLRDDVPVVVLSASRVPNDTTPDQARLPFWSEIALDKLAPGNYVLEVTATDRSTKASITQTVQFVVE